MKPCFQEIFNSTNNLKLGKDHCYQLKVITVVLSTFSGLVSKGSQAQHYVNAIEEKGEASFAHFPLPTGALYKHESMRKETHRPL